MSGCAHLRALFDVRISLPTLVLLFGAGNVDQRVQFAFYELQETVDASSSGLHLVLSGVWCFESSVWLPTPGIHGGCEYATLTALCTPTEDILGAGSFGEVMKGHLFHSEEEASAGGEGQLVWKYVHHHRHTSFHFLPCVLNPSLSTLSCIGRCQADTSAPIQTVHQAGIAVQLL